MASSGDDNDPAVADTAISNEPAAAEPAEPVPPRRSVHTGDVLGRYELVEEIGEGGMATVYRARDRELRRDVAVKVLFPHLARKPDIVRRFHREARAAAGLEHANILRVYDVGAEPGEPPYIVMELVRGRALLAEIERRGAVLAEVVACMGALLADALAVAHAAGVIHRDVKPANVLIAPGGRLLLADFGVARLETEDSLVTRTGAVLGTPAYMSPEQATGDTATARSDLYSLGVTLYQLATGALPYGGSSAKVLAQIASGAATTAVRRRAAVGPDLSRAIERLMAIDPMQRPASAAEVARELREVAAAGGLGDPAEELAAYFEDPERFARERTPAIAAKTVAAGRAALAGDKLPRAIALADRASALAPDDPAVAALVEAVTEGGRTSRRRRALAIGGAIVLLAGGATAAVLELRGGAMPSAPRDAQAGALVARADAAAGSAAAVARADAAVALAASFDAAAPDAAAAHVVALHPLRPHHGAARDAAMPLVADAAPRAAIDAAPRPPADAPPAAGAIVVTNDVWCDVYVDKQKLGERGVKILVPAGRHLVRCEQFGHGWERTVDVAPGQVTTVAGTLLGKVEVHFAIDAALDGVPHHRGDVVQVQAGQHGFAAGGRTAYVDLRVACTVQGDLECTP